MRANAGRSTSQRAIGERRFLPRAHDAVVFEVRAKERGDELAQGRVFGIEIERGEALGQLVHQHDEQLPLRTKVEIERAGRDSGVRGDVFDRRRLVAARAEERAPGVQNARALLHAALLARQREIFHRRDERALHRPAPAPATAPAQQISIHPPKIPAADAVSAADGATFGKSEAKNKQENGSNTSVGSASSVTPSIASTRSQRNKRSARRNIATKLAR